MSSSDAEENCSISDKENVCTKQCFVSLKRLNAVDVYRHKQYLGCNVAVVKPIVRNRTSSLKGLVKPCTVNVCPIELDPVIVLDRFFPPSSM